MKTTNKTQQIIEEEIREFEKKFWNAKRGGIRTFDKSIDDGKASKYARMNDFRELLSKSLQRVAESAREEESGDIKVSIERFKDYTHDRSESGFDDIRGACGEPCYQCKKDEKFLAQLKSTDTEK